MQDRTCSIGGCEGRPHRRGWCSKHYARWTRHGDTSIVKQVHTPSVSACVVDGCELPRPYIKGYCQMHHARWRRHGDPLFLVDTKKKRPTSPTLTVEEKQCVLDAFKSCELSEIPTPGFDARCLVWTGQENDCGYGQVSLRGRNAYVHRLSHQIFNDPAFPIWAGRGGLRADHLCRNPPCVEPTHLEAITHRENLVRGLNSALKPTKVSRFVGVHRSKNQQRWTSYIMFAGKQYYLGTFDLEEDAAAAYDHALRSGRVRGRQVIQ